MSSNSSEVKFSTNLVFFVNGKKIIEEHPDPECTLLTYLRNTLQLCGTKLGCGEGGCGACTVMISRLDRQTNKVKHLAVNACLTPVCAVHGCAVVTIEGIGETRTRLHPLQERLANAHGSQCGFCTPGIIMSIYALIRSSPNPPSIKEMEVTLQGNLCRCTGYRPILEGMKPITKEFECDMGNKCCRLNGNDCETTINENYDFAEIDTELFEKHDYAPCHPSQEPIYPPALLLSSELDDENLVFEGPRVTWYRPTSLEKLALMKAKNPSAKIVVGNTEVGVEVKFKHLHYPVLISPSAVPELNVIEVTPNDIFFGASVSLVDIENTLREQIDTLPEFETRFFKCVVDMMQYFAGKQIRNVASLGGNIMTGSPISDMNPILSAGSVELEVMSSVKGKLLHRKINMGKGFFTGYRKSVIEPNEILVGLRLPKTVSNQYVVAFKQARRRDDDIAIVNAAINVIFQPKSNVVDSITMAFGGMGPMTVMPLKSCEAMLKQKWDQQLVERIAESLNAELPLAASAPGGMIAYRRALVTSLFFKAYLAIGKKLMEDGVIDKDSIPVNELSGADVFHTPILKSAQLFERPNKDQPLYDPIGRPKVHASAYKQVTGEAIYVDDIPRSENELYLALVLSSRAHAKIISIDATAALSMNGVHAFYSSESLTEEQNKIGPVLHDEEVFASKEVKCQGQVIGAVVADNQRTAQEAARAVLVKYEDLTPLIITIEEAIAHQSYFAGYPKFIIKGNVDNGFKDSDFVFENNCRMGGQEHFYLETHGCIARLRDTDELEIISSTQHPTEVQKLAAHVLSLPSNRVVCRAKRLGGGFGGKESRSVITALPAAIACHRLRRPIRAILDRDEDMMTTGNRHPFLFKYKVGCTKEGKINACYIECYSNGGWSMDLSFSVLDRAMNHFENCYVIPHIKVGGWICKTNLPSNTAFRGFGGPQGMFAGEHIIRDVAHIVGKDYLDVMKLNFYKSGDITHYNQVLEHFPIQR